jgi:hypothetical protein
MVVLTERERQLLEKLGIEGKATELGSDEVLTAKALERADLVFLVSDGTGRAVITPKGRRLLAGLGQKPKSTTAPFRYT